LIELVARDWVLTNLGLQRLGGSTVIKERSFPDLVFARMLSQRSPKVRENLERDRKHLEDQRPDDVEPALWRRILNRAASRYPLRARTTFAPDRQWTPATRV
jgi:hypothetical protein